MTIAVGEEVLGEETLELMLLPDGAPGALRQGQVFPVRADGAIDVAGPFCLPAACKPVLGLGCVVAWALSADDPPLLLITGDAAARDAVLAVITRAGGRIRTAGSYLADCDQPEPVADWFALPEGLSRDELQLALAVIPAGVGREPGSSPDPARPLEAAAEREAVLRQALEQLRREVRSASVGLSEMAARLRQTEAAWSEEATARAAAEQLARAVGESQVEPIAKTLVFPAAARRAMRDLGETIATILPRVVLLGSSLELLSFGMRQRGPVLRILRDLHDQPNETLAGWKNIHGAAGWRERHVSTGQDDSGRVYARHSSQGRVQVLVSVKGMQDRDIDWLRRVD